MKIAVYGANGYQGKLVLAELARREIEMVLVGRDRDRLRDAAAGVPGAERRTARLDGHDGLAAAFGGCAAVVNCAGPFTHSGHAVIRAALAAGCHYVDTAGEQAYIASVFDVLGPEAERAGVTVVPAVTDACLPCDLLARLIAERIDPIEEIVVGHFVTGGGGPSRGTLRSIAATMDLIRTGGLVYGGGVWGTGAPPRRTSLTLPGDPHPTEVCRFPLPEVVTIPRHVPVTYVEGVAEAALAARFAAPLTPEIIDALPEGPAEDARRAQRFTLVVEAATPYGRTARGLIEGADTYGTTAVTAVEAARVLAADPPKPGVLTPAQAYDPTEFLDFLARHGVTRSITVS